MASKSRNSIKNSASNPVDLTGNGNNILRPQTRSLGMVGPSQFDDLDSVEGDNSGDDATSSTSMFSDDSNVAQRGARFVSPHVPDLNISPSADNSASNPLTTASTHEDGSGMINHPVPSAGDAVLSNIAQRLLQPRRSLRFQAGISGPI